MKDLKPHAYNQTEASVVNIRCTLRLHDRFLDYTHEFEHVRIVPSDPLLPSLATQEEVDSGELPLTSERLMRIVDLMEVEMGDEEMLWDELEMTTGLDSNDFRQS